MVIGYISALNTSIEDIPVISLALNAVGDADSFDAMKEDVVEAAEELEDVIDEREDELEDKLSSQELKALDNLLDATKDCAKTMSINNLQKMAKAMNKISDTDIAELADIEDSLEGIEEAIEILSTVSSALMWMMIVALVFTVLGALCRSNVLVVFGAIFTTIYYLIFCGALFVILNLVAHIALIVLHSQIKKEYKAYRSGTLAA